MYFCRILKVFFKKNLAQNSSAILLLNPLVSLTSLTQEEHHIKNGNIGQYCHQTCRGIET